MIKSIGLLHTNVHFGLTDTGLFAKWPIYINPQCACANLNFLKPVKRGLKVKL